MQRRRFLQATSALLPFLTGCHIAAGYDRTKHGTVQKVALAFLVQETRVFATIGYGGNIFSTMGEEQAIARRIQNALGAGLDRFQEAFRAEMKAALAAQGLIYTEVPAGQSGITTRPDYRKSGMPFALESQPILCFERAADGITPGAMHFGRLLTSDGTTLFRINVSLGSSCRGPFEIVAPISQRFSTFDEIIRAPQPVLSFLMTLSAPLARSAVSELMAASRAA